MPQSKTDKPQGNAALWEERYRTAGPETSGQPGKALAQFASGLAPGHALELGCGKGDDAVWLARQGWTVTASEIAPSALKIAAANAARAGMAEKVSFVLYDLTESFPEGSFDLVLSCFLAAQPRGPVFRRAAAAVAPGGHLLLIDHAEPLPWRKGSAKRGLWSAAETLEALDLDPAGWITLHADIFTRDATSPDGDTVSVHDTVVFLQRRLG